MWRVHGFILGLIAIVILPILSQWRRIGLCISKCRSASNVMSQDAVFEASAKAMYSASDDDRATVGCFLEYHVIGKLQAYFSISTVLHWGLLLLWISILWMLRIFQGTNLLGATHHFLGWICIRPWSRPSILDNPMKLIGSKMEVETTHQATWADVLFDWILWYGQKY